MKTPLKFAAIALLLAANLWAAGAASAHDWGKWHWNRAGNPTTINVYNTASYKNETSAAVNEWSNDTILNLPQVNSHSDVHVFDGNYGAVGWGGIARIMQYSGNHILHGHAELNYYYSYSSNGKRGVQCQEVGHLFGLTHSNDGGCMGFGYWYGESGSTYYQVIAHNINDIYSKYITMHTTH
jgi:predicted Zn-dependent protease